MNISQDARDIVSEIKDVACPLVSELTLLLCGSASVFFILGFFWIPELAWLAALPFGILWERSARIEKWAKQKVRWLEIEDEIKYYSSSERLERSIKEVTESRERLSDKMREWTSQKPTIFERVFLERRHRKDEHNELLNRMLREACYIESRLLSERDRALSHPLE
jgi:hypothetical protein